MAPRQVAAAVALTVVGLLAVRANSFAIIGRTDIEAQRRCSTNDRENLRDMAFALRVAVATDAFDRDLANHVATDYRPRNVRLSREPFGDAPRDVQAAMALLASRSVNRLDIRCRRFIALGHGRAWGEDPHDSYFREQIKMEEDGLVSFETDSDRFFARAGLILHEVLHLFGYEHVRHGRDRAYDQSMNQVARHSMHRVLRAAAAAGDLAPDVTEDCPDGSPCPVRTTLREYRQLGYLVFPPETPGGPPRFAFDPLRRGLGLLAVRPGTDDVRLLDAALHGRPMKRHLRIRFEDAWTPDPADEVVAIGPLLPSTAPDEWVVRGAGGIAAVSWSGADEPSNFRVFARARFGDSLSGDGGGWRVDPGDAVLGVVRLYGLELMGLPREPAGELVIARDGAVAFLAARDGGFSVARQARVGATVSTPWGSRWTIDADQRALAIGDFDGDRIDDVLVGSARGLAVLSHRRRLDPVVAVTWRPSSDVTGWDARPDQRVLAVGDFDGDGRDEWWMSNSDGVVLMELDSAARVFRSALRLPFGTPLSADWSFTFRDTFGAAGHFASPAREAVVINGGPGLALLSLDPAGRSVLSNHLRPGRPLLDRDEAITNWITTPADAGAAAGDFDGDGLDDIVVESPTGIAILRTDGRGGLRLLDYRIANCSAGRESCHGALWGHWLVRSTDVMAGAVARSGGTALLLLHNTGSE